MRTPLFFSLFVLAGSAVAQAPAQEELDKDAQTRIRTERSAGGLGKITPEEKAGAEVGAGPHKQFKPEGAARRDPREDSGERQSARGGSRAEAVESGDARTEPARR